MRRLTHRAVSALLPLVVLAACNTKVSFGLGTDQFGDCLVGEQAARRMMVICQNPQIAGRADAERKTTARKVAEYVRDHDDKYKGLDDVTVMFLGKKEVSDKEIESRVPRYTFTTAELGKPRAAAASPRPDSAGAAGDSSAAS
jgi:hypothetical protein